MSATAPDSLPNGRRATPDGRAERSKRAAVVARRIEDDIAALGWPVGTVLGTEPELCARYGASRSVLLEAIRLVEHHQVATMRRGPKGGLVIREPDLLGTATALVVYLDHVGTTVADLMDGRIVLEPLAVRLAASALTEDGVAALRLALDEDVVGAADTGVMLPDRIHQAIAAQCGNPVLELFLRVLVNLNVLFSDPSTPIPQRQLATLAKQMSHEHDELIEAIITGRGDHAADLTVDHLARLRDLMLSRQGNRRRPGHVAWPEGRSSRYAEALAERIRLDLANDGAVPGDVIGSETDIREKYGVSRQVLREAVRLLEHHGVAKMQRGPGGGLVVTEPDPWASIEAIAVYLNYQQMESSDLRSVWSAVELACLDRVLARHDDPEVVSRLRASVAVHESATGDVGEVLARSLHHELAALAGSPVLELFILILSSLWGRHVVSAAETSPLRDKRRMRAARTAHARIVEAIVAGDGSLARSLLARHHGDFAEIWESPG